MAIMVGRRDKHLKLNQAKIEKARRLLGVRTETEAVERSLDFVIGEREINSVLRKGMGRGRIERVFR